MYIEHFVENPRHIEFQILADKFGNVIHLGERDCSIQRNHQKMIEESPSVILSDELRKKMGDTAVRAAKAAKYENVPVGCWTVVGRCYYATSDGRTYYPESASVQKATFSPYKGGISSTTTAQYQSSTSQIMENGKRTQVSLHYSCPILVKHYTNASKQNAKATYSEYIYSTNITTTSLQSTTTIYFYRYN